MTEVNSRACHHFLSPRCQGLQIFRWLGPHWGPKKNRLPTGSSILQVRAGNHPDLQWWASRGGRFRDDDPLVWEAQLPVISSDTSASDCWFHLWLGWPTYIYIYTWIFIGYKFLSRADFGLISDHFLEIYPFQNKNDHFKKKHATSCFHFWVMMNLPGYFRPFPGYFRLFPGNFRPEKSTHFYAK